MEAVGQLTGGIAHDFNNILTVITGTIDILAEPVTHNRQLTEITALIRDAAERGASLTRHLLAFARKQPLQPTTLSANNGSEALAVLDSGAPIDLCSPTSSCRAR
ncbi:signal transduction histidine kinase [Bradyrhizobium elkanii]|nr:signal transduction histidine kinase [Bradyrhizobium elkanii]